MIPNESTDLNEIPMPDHLYNRTQAGWAAMPDDLADAVEAFVSAMLIHHMDRGSEVGHYETDVLPALERMGVVIAPMLTDEAKLGNENGRRLCICGHPARDHYLYQRNADVVSRCKRCDPMTGQPSGNYEMQSGTYVSAMYRAADHDFEPADEAA